MPYAAGYLRIYLLGTVFVMISLGMNYFINTQGFAGTGMLTVAIGAVLNLILDPVFIFGFDMGVPGAALATILSQAVSAAWALWFLFSRRAILRLRPRAFRWDGGRVRRITALGLSNFIALGTNGVVQIACNATLQSFGGDLYVGVMTVLTAIREVVQMPLSGLTQRRPAGHELQLRRVPVGARQKGHPLYDGRRHRLRHRVLGRAVLLPPRPSCCSLTTSPPWCRRHPPPCTCTSSATL